MSIRHRYYIDRPSPIVAAVTIMWVQFAIGVIAFCALFALVDTTNANLPDGVGAVVTLLVLLIIGVLFLQALLAVKIFHGKNWARITEIVLCSIALGFGVIGLFAAETETIMWELIGIGINITLIVLLTREDSAVWCKQFD